MTKSSKSTLVALAALFVFSVLFWLSTGIYWPDGITGHILGVILLATPVVLTLIVHWAWVVPGSVFLWTLPLSWGLCLLPDYLLSYYIFPIAPLNNYVNFVVSTLSLILPSGVIATVLAVVQAVKGARVGKKK